MARRNKYSALSPDFQQKKLEEQKRTFSKTVLFNAKERAVIEQYCKKYCIRNESAFIRETVIQRILEQMGEDYPKLF